MRDLVTLSALPVSTRACRDCIPESIAAPMRRCPDYPDFPTAWAIQHDHGTSLTHHPRCSSVPGWDPISGPSFLCDCGAVEQEWKRLRALLELEHSDA